jgi:Ca-activated chloride channel family protein
MALLSHLVWREPQWLWLALFPWLQWALRAILDRRGGRGYADPGLMPWARARTAARFAPRGLWRHGVFALAWLLFALAAAGPRIALTNYGQESNDETQVMAVIDLSRSMTARDIAPSRLQRAKLELEDLIAREDHLRIGLVVYAARPHLMIPPTDDRSVLRHDLQLLRYGLLPTEGSSLRSALAFAARQFYPGPSARVVLLLSDGETATQGAAADRQLDDTASTLAQKGIRIYALGIGTVDGAPLQGPDGNWLQYSGRPVVTRLHEDRLQQLARIGNGRYARVADTDSDWQTLYDRGIRYEHGATTARHGDQLVQWRELFAWFLVPAIVLLMLSYLEPRRRSSLAPALIPWFALLAIAGAAHPVIAHAASASWQVRGYKAYQDGSYREAQQDYARVAGYVGRMGEGSSAYRQASFHQAIALFTQAVLDADSDAQRARAIFNLANSHYQLADYAAAIALYKETLRYDRRDHAARINLGYAADMYRRQQLEHRRGRGGHPGPGPRSAQPPSGTQTNGGFLGLEPEKPGKEGPARPPPGSSATDLIEQGIYRSRPAVGKVVKHKDPLWRYAATSPARIVLQADSIKVDEATLWKRIFESEEGIPVPVATPRPLPGIAPW